MTLPPDKNPANENIPEEEPPSEYLHWYCLSFASSDARACAYVGYPEMKITMLEITRARKYAFGTDKVNATLLAATYLGFMTKKEFNS
jgi:hypothetical protein